MRRVPAWNQFPSYLSRGRAHQISDTKFKMLCRYKALSNSEAVARNAVRWDALLPSFLRFCSMQVPLRNGQVIEVLDRGSTHKWLGCMLCTASTGNHASDLAHPLQAALKAFFAHTDLFWSTGMLLCETVSNILTPWSLPLLVSVLRTEQCTNKTCAGWILCFASYYVFVFFPRTFFPQKVSSG